MPRGYGVLGYVLRRPEDDRHIQTRTELETNIDVGLGGTLAEELVYGDFSTGAASDLEKVNQIARRMVKMFGMSRLGRIFHRDGESPPSFLTGLSELGPRDHSEETAREIDLEVRAIIDGATERVRELLKRNLTALEAGLWRRSRNAWSKRKSWTARNCTNCWPRTRSWATRRRLAFRCRRKMGIMACRLHPEL